MEFWNGHSLASNKVTIIGENWGPDIIWLPEVSQQTEIICSGSAQPVANCDGTLVEKSASRRHLRCWEAKSSNYKDCGIERFLLEATKT